MFALTRKGPFLSLLRATKLLRGEGRVARATLPILAATWVPFVLLALVSQRPRLLLADVSIHVRLLVSIPLLLQAEDLLHHLYSHVLAYLSETRIDGGSGDIEDLLRESDRVGDSALSEAACLGIALFLGQLSVWGSKAGLLDMRVFTHHPLSPAMLWYGFVAWPVFAFLLLRLLWRWLVWCWVLWRFSRLKLGLIPTHPDLSGGLGMLAEPIPGFALMVLALALNAASSWGMKIVFLGAKISSFAGPLALLIALSLLFGLGPLVAFSGKLFRLKREGRVQYGELALAYTTRFHERWIVHQETEGLLGTSDIQSLSDLANSYDVIRRMRFTPCDRFDALLLVAAVLVPMIPLALVEVPLDQLARQLASALL
jgi:hypothetical protein